MKNWKVVPKNSLVAQYVECYWFLEKEAADDANNNPKLNPDPSAHLMVVKSSQNFSYQQGANTQTSRGCHWIFAHRQAYLMDHSDPFQVLGIKFKVGGLYSLALIDNTAALDSIVNVDLSELLNIDAFDIDRLIQRALTDKHAIRDALDELILPWLANHPIDQHAALTRKVLPLLETMPIQSLSTQLHRSQRTIERSFLKTTQLTLKQCQSMMRLEQVLEHLYGLDQSEINWSDVAQHFAFSDQPHLIRYLKSAIGHTPAQYAHNRDLTIDIYGDFKLD